MQLRSCLAVVKQLPARFVCWLGRQSGMLTIDCLGRRFLDLLPMLVLVLSVHSVSPCDAVGNVALSPAVAGEEVLLLDPGLAKRLTLPDGQTPEQLAAATLEQRVLSMKAQTRWAHVPHRLPQSACLLARHAAILQFDKLAPVLHLGVHCACAPAHVCAAHVDSTRQEQDAQPTQSCSVTKRPSLCRNCRVMCLTALQP